MMGRLKHEQEQLFYSFRLDEAVPDDHSVRAIAAVLNRVFSPDPAKVEYARRVVEAFEEGIKRGTASVNLDGKMVDIPVVKRAEVILARARVVAETERRKADALARLR